MTATGPSFTDFGPAYFEQQYRNYRRQNPPRKLHFYRELVEAAAAGRARPRILDLGCAFGLFLSTLGDRWDRFGVDASDYAIDEARRRTPEATFAVAGAGNFPFTGQFDVITAFDVLEHIPDLENVLFRVSRSLVPDGAFIFVVPVYDGPTGPIIRALDRDPTHIHKEARNVWLSRVSERFCVTDWQGIYRYLVGGAFYVHVVTRALRNCTPAIACFTRVRSLEQGAAGTRCEARMIQKT